MKYPISAEPLPLDSFMQRYSLFEKMKESEWRPRVDTGSVCTLISLGLLRSFNYGAHQRHLFQCKYQKSSASPEEMFCFFFLLAPWGLSKSLYWVLLWQLEILGLNLWSGLGNVCNTLRLLDLHINITSSFMFFFFYAPKIYSF